MDGKALAAQVRGEVAEQVKALARPIGLATVLVGEDQASALYVRRKQEACEEVGIEPIHHELGADTSEEALLGLVADLNADDRVTGILVQLPLPDHIDEGRVIRAIAPIKDVDGFHPASAGHLLQGEPTFVAATPAGIMEILRAYEIPLEGARAVVVGRSNIVGKPMALLLLAENATVTMCHSRTRDLPGVVREADVVVAAVGRAGMVTREMVQGGRRGHRRRDQPRRRQGRRGRGRGRSGGRRLRDPGAGRRRADDDRQSAPEYRSCRGIPAGLACLPGRLTLRSFRVAKERGVSRATARSRAVVCV